MKDLKVRPFFLFLAVTMFLFPVREQTQVLLLFFYLKHKGWTSPCLRTHFSGSTPQNWMYIKKTAFLEQKKNKTKRLIKYSAVLYPALTELRRSSFPAKEKASIFNMSCYYTPLQLCKWSRYAAPLSVVAFSPCVYPEKLLLTIRPEISAKLRSIDPVIVVHALTLTP